MNGIIQSRWAVIGSIKLSFSLKNFYREIFLALSQEDVSRVGELAIRKVLLAVMVLRKTCAIYP